MFADETCETALGFFVCVIVTPHNLVPGLLRQRLEDSHAFVSLSREHAAGKLLECGLQGLVCSLGTDALVGSHGVNEAWITWVVAFEEAMEAPIANQPG
jgi:hypothetical protein